MIICISATRKRRSGLCLQSCHLTELFRSQVSHQPEAAVFWCMLANMGFGGQINHLPRQTTPRELQSQCVPPCFFFFPSGTWGCFCVGLFYECMHAYTCVYTDAHICGSQRTTSSLSSSVTVPLDSEIHLSLNLKLYQPG